MTPAPTAESAHARGMAWVYILRCSDGSFYTGSTIDLERRLWEHNEGLGANYTKTRTPVTLAYAEESRSVEDAFLREKRIQGWSRAKKLAVIEGRWSDLPGLSANAVARSAPSTGSGTETQVP
jgi:putative endonuclease